MKTINDYKHPIAAKVDEMVLRDEDPKSIVKLLTSVNLVDVKRVAESCVFIGRIFQPDFCYRVADSKLLSGLQAYLPFIPSVLASEYCRCVSALGDLIRYVVGSDVDMGFYKDHAAEDAIDYGEVAFAFDRKIAERLSQGVRFDRILDEIEDRAVSAGSLLQKSHWRSRFYQLDVFEHATPDNVWLLLACMDRMPSAIVNSLCSQAFLGVVGNLSPGVARLRKHLWAAREVFRFPDGRPLPLAAFCVPDEAELLGGCCGVDADEAYVIENWHVNTGASPLERFVNNDSIGEFELGRATTGLEVSEDLVRYAVDRQLENIISHFLENGLHGDRILTQVVDRVCATWPEDSAVRFLRLVFAYNNRVVSSAHDGLGRGLLLRTWFSRTKRQLPWREVSGVLEECGCDPDCKCYGGFCWSEVKEGEGL